MGNVVNVVKASGAVEPFSEEKVISSLLRTGASKDLAEKILSRIKPHLYQNIPTFEIHSAVIKSLKREEEDLADKYNLKKAIIDLGPTGYPFEKFVAAVLGEIGYSSELNKVVMGKCVSHEIDIVARNKKNYMIECKFHNQQGYKTDVKTALYTYARFLDIKESGFDGSWLITNTKLTQEAITYALCVGMKLTSWNYPEGESLRDIVDKSGLHPITSSTSLSLKEKQSLIDKGIIYCRDFKNCPPSGMST